MKRAILIIVALGLSAFAIYKLLFNTEKPQQVTAPVAVDIVPVDSQFAANKKHRSP